MNEFSLRLLALAVCALSMCGSVGADPPAAPSPPTNYLAVLDEPVAVYLSFETGAGAHYTRHEISTDGGLTWQRLDDDYAPAEQSYHSLPEDSVCLLRAKTVSAAGASSAYTDVQVVITGNFNGSI